MQKEKNKDLMPEMCLQKEETAACTTLETKQQGVKMGFYFCCTSDSEQLRKRRRVSAELQTSMLFNVAPFKVLKTELQTGTYLVEGKHWFPCYIWCVFLKCHCPGTLAAHISKPLRSGQRPNVNVPLRPRSTRENVLLKAVWFHTCEAHLVWKKMLLLWYPAAVMQNVDGTVRPTKAFSLEFIIQVELIQFHL